MILNGFYQMVDDAGELRRVRGCKFESTSAKTNGKVIWRKLKKDGTPTNTFAEQFIPDVPWLPKGKWFCKLDGGVVLRDHPELKVETEISKRVSHEAYCEYLSSNYHV